MELSQTSDNLHLCCVLDQVVREVDRPLVPLVVGEVWRVGGVAVEHVAAGQEEAERGGDDVDVDVDIDVDVDVV